MPPSFRFYITLLSTLILASYSGFFGNIFTVNADTCTDEKMKRPEVRILQGKIRGVNMVTRLGRKIFGFQGIPFARAPVGNLRFKGPVPAAAWNDTLDGSIDSKPCLQPKGETILGNEDCLYVNIYTPRLPMTENSTLLPVMVYVFGGRFSIGTNDLTRFGPGFILDKDVVLVVPNYRLGVLGYLSTGDEISPGNFGLKDLVLALQWTRDNVRYFGGDLNRVTLVGGSSGAVSVHLLTLSDSTKGLFHGYITQSGTALAVDACQSRQEYAKLATRLGECLGCPTNTSALLVDCLRGFDASRFIGINPAIRVWRDFPLVVWGPTIEPEMEGALITDHPRNLLAAGKVRDLPWLQSITRDEGVVVGVFLYEKPEVYQEFFNNLDTLLPIVLPYYGSVDKVKPFIDAVKSYYFNNPIADASLLLNNFTQLMGDYIMMYPSHCAARQHLIHAKQPHYLCSLEYRGTVSYSYMLTGGATTNWGVTHGDELLYLFPGEKSLFGPPGWEFNENDWKMVDTMVQLWTSFIINGTPTIADPNSTVVWEPYSSRHNYLRIGDGLNPTLKVGYDLLLDRMRFWEELDSTLSWHNST